MVKQISIKKYRKLQDIEFVFSEGINVISGTNGTCKTSLLHIISNSFQAVTKKCDWLTDFNCLDTIRKINSITNPKLESLTKGDKEYNDPSNGLKGTLFQISYFDTNPLEFRKHNSIITNRYAVKPYYSKRTKESLPFCPVIYLGLARLFPFGEFQNDDAIIDIKKCLPIFYQNEIIKIYKEFTGITVSSSMPQKMGDIKIRTDFSSDIIGIDSNTISAGEDNLFIIISALVSLKYYYDCIDSKNKVESILLIDELDATLHPSFQNKLLKLFRKYSDENKIQIVFTTHSLSLIEYALEEKHNVIYLIDDVLSVINLDSPDIFKIKQYLKNISHHEIFHNKVIPIFTEDAEARIFFNSILEYFKDTKTEFRDTKSFFHLVNANIGSGNLRNIFNDTYLIKSTMQAICLLDGDRTKNIQNHIISLPGNKSPEELIMEYSKKLFDNDDPFWRDNTIISLNFGKVYYREHILPDIDSINEKISSKKEADLSAHGDRRELNKKVFTKHQRFFELLFKHWVNNMDNEKAVEDFYTDLYIMFKKVAAFHDINPNEWQISKE